MKTIHIITHYIGGTGGVQVYNETLANILAKLGYKVNLIGLAKQDNDSIIYFQEQSNPNVNFISLNNEDIFFRKPQIFLYNLFNKKISEYLNSIINKDDIIIVSNPICMPFVAQIPNWKQYNIIAQFHGSVKLAMEGKGMYYVYRMLIKKYYKNVRHFLVLTEEDANELKIKYQFENVDFLINPSRFKFETIQTDVANSKQILFLGRLDKIKQIDHIVKAFELSNLQKKGYVLNIYGDGPEKDKIQKVISKNKIKGVFLKGRTSNVEEVMKMSALIIMSSKSEGLPLNLIEAVSLGLPILTYDTSAGIREVVKDGYNGYLVEINNIQQLSNKLVSMITDKHNLVTFSENSYDLSDKFSTVNFTEKLKSFL